MQANNRNRPVLLTLRVRPGVARSARRFVTRSVTSTARRGYTLIEILLATLLTLAMMLVVVRVFGDIGQSVTDTRALVETQNSLRAVVNRLKRDLESVTATMRPPLRPEAGQGYFEIIEGPVGAVTAILPALPAWLQPVNTDVTSNQPDTTVRDNDDILMCTIRSRGEPFVGRFLNGTVESQEAEVAYFVRGRTLYRRVLLVAPGRFMDLDDPRKNPIANGDGVVTAVEAGLPLDANGNRESVFKWYDVSVRPALAQDNVTRGMIANTLGDLTKPENRYAHQAGKFPYSPHYVTNRPQYTLGMPLLAECASPAFFWWDRNVNGIPDWTDSNGNGTWDPGEGDSGWLLGVMPPISVSQAGGAVFDAWRNPHPWNETDPDTGILMAYAGPRVGEDIILNNVLDFDVKVFDPEAWVVVNDAGLANANDPNAAALLPGDPGYAAALVRTTAPISKGAYVDLGYGYGIVWNLNRPNPPPPAALLQPPCTLSWFSNLPVPPYTYVIEPSYDTWSTHYENNWYDTNQNGLRDAGDAGDENGNGAFDEGTNGFDDNSNGVVDDPAEQEAPPPYPAPFRGIQIKIRVFEGDTRQVREVTLVHDFLPK